MLGFRAVLKKVIECGIRKINYYTYMAKAGGETVNSILQAFFIPSVQHRNTSTTLFGLILPQRKPQQSSVNPQARLKTAGLGVSETDKYNLSVFFSAIRKRPSAHRYRPCKKSAFDVSPSLSRRSAKAPLPAPVRAAPALNSDSLRRIEQRADKTHLP